MNETKVHVRRRYRLDPDASQNWFAAVARLGEDVDDTTYISNSATIRSRPDYRFNFGTFGEWSSFVRDNWKVIQNADVSLFKDNRSVGLSCSLDRGEAEISASAPSLPEVDSTMALLERALQLPVLEEPDLDNTRGNLSSVRASRRYRFSRDADQGWFAAVSRLREDVREKTHVSGSATIGSQPDFTFSFGTVEEWQTFVRDKWDEVLRADVRLYHDDVSISLSCDLGQGEAQLDANAPTLSEVQERIAGLERVLKLPALPERDKQHIRGLRRRYFVNTPITPTWLEGITEALRRDFGNFASVDGRFRLADAKYTEFVFRDLSEWRSEVLKSWDRLGSVYLWLWAEGRKVMFDCDLRRMLLTLESEAPSYDEAVSLLSALEKPFDLSEAAENPYQYRRFARFFEIRKWKAGTNAAFAGAVREALSKSFALPPALETAYVTHGGSEQDLEPFPSVDRFLEYVGDTGSEYDEAHLYVEGPRGQSLGIALDRKDRKLTIRSSLDRKEFNRVADAFENAIDLKLVKDTSPKENGGAPTSGKYEFLGKLALAAFGLFLSVEFIQEMVPRDELEITFPRTDADGVAVVSPDTLRPYWIVRRTRWWDTKDLSNAPPASVRLLDSHGRILLERSGLQPGPGMPVGAGDYQLIVAIPELGESKDLRLRVVSATAPAAIRSE